MGPHLVQYLALASCSVNHSIAVLIILPSFSLYSREKLKGICHNCASPFTVGFSGKVALDWPDCGSQQLASGGVRE